MREIQPLIKNISNYQKLKPLYDTYTKAKDKSAFRSKYEAELVIFEAARSTISGAGKTFETFPDILDNVIPYIGGEEEKSEQEPLKLWGHIEGVKIVSAESPRFTAQPEKRLAAARKRINDRRTGAENNGQK